MNTGIIILAAGESSRLGKPKQLLEFHKKTLLEIVSEAAVESGFNPIVVVLGAYAEEISKQHHHTDITYVINDSWKEGMSSSISAGMSALLNQDKDLENVVIAVSDQAYISSDILKGLLQTRKQTGKHIIASRYAQTIGTPALFNKKYFDQLFALEGNKGAKELLSRFPDDTETISFEQGNIDIDTEADYNNLIDNR